MKLLSMRYLFHEKNDNRASYLELVDFFCFFTHVVTLRFFLEKVTRKFYRLQ